MADTKTRELILQRRAKFVAAALATASIAAAAAGTNGCCPQTCLKVDEDADAAMGRPCLSIAPVEQPAQDAGADAVAPRVCLSPPRTPRDG